MSYNPNNPNGQATMANSAPVVIASNQSPIPVTISGAITPLEFANRGANNTQNVKATSGQLLSFSCYNDAGATRWIQFHNTATVPVNGNVPKKSYLVPGKSQLLVGSDVFTINGITFSIGIAFAFSTTRDTLTLATATDQSTQINYL